VYPAVGAGLEGAEVVSREIVSSQSPLYLSMRSVQWYSVVNPRGAIGWSWVGLLTVDPSIAASISVGSADPGVTVVAAPTQTPTADIDDP
jgi:hypothetical protein